MKKYFTTLLAVGLLSSLQVGCSDDSSSSDPAPQQNQSDNGTNLGENSNPDGESNNPNTPNQPTPTDPTQLLFSAIATGDLDAVKELMSSEQGLGLNALVDDDKTALMVAAEWGRLDIVNYLIEQGVDTKLTSKNGLTAAMIAKKNGFNEIYRVIEGLSYTLDELNAGLMQSVNDRKIKQIQYFVDLGAEIEHLDQRGLTPLFRAILTENLEIVQLMVNLGADPARVVAIQGREIDALGVAKNMIKNKKIADFLAAQLQG